MSRYKGLMVVPGVLLIGLGAVAQQPSTPPAASGSGVTTVQGCLRGQRGNYIVIEDKTGLVYALKGVGNKLEAQRRHEVEIKGKVLPGTVKTGINPSKEGSNPSDTEHGVDGVPFQIANPATDVRTIAKNCKAADQQ